MVRLLLLFYISIHKHVHFEMMKLRITCLGLLACQWLIARVNGNGESDLNAAVDLTRAIGLNWSGWEFSVRP